MFSVLVLVPKCMCTEEDKLGLVLSFCHVMLRSLDLVVSISIQWLPDISFNLMLIIFLLLCVCVWTCVYEFHLEKMEVVVVGNIFHLPSTLRIEAESVNQTQSSLLCLISLGTLLWESCLCFWGWNCRRAAWLISIYVASGDLGPHARLASISAIEPSP